MMKERPRTKNVSQNQIYIGPDVVEKIIFFLKKAKDVAQHGVRKDQGNQKNNNKRQETRERGE
jgi:Holliday junction resolvase